MGCTGVAVVGFLVSLLVVCRHLGEPLPVIGPRDSDGVGVVW